MSIIGDYDLDVLRSAVGPAFQVTTSRGGHIADVTVRPESVGPSGKCDMVRVIEDDGTYRVIHMTHNQVERGEIHLRGSLTGMLGTVVRELTETF